MLQMYIFYFKYVCKMVNNCKKKDIIVIYCGFVVGKYI